MKSVETIGALTTRSRTTARRAATTVAMIHPHQTINAQIPRKTGKMSRVLTANGTALRRAGVLSTVTRGSTMVVKPTTFAASVEVVRNPQWKLRRSSNQGQKSKIRAFSI